jgi:uncharacterized metal-binding protein YceD (DUF177 family)
MKQSSEQLPWSVPIKLHEISDGGQRRDIAADATIRQQVAALAGVRDIPRLEASFDVRRHGLDGVRVAGHVSGRVAQTCVVTLEPMESALEEEVDVVFMPKRMQSRVDEEVEVQLEGDDGPELLVGDAVDLGAIAIEFALLGIDPYPRKPDAAFEPPAAAEDPSDHPFAALAALKRRSGKADS